VTLTKDLFRETLPPLHRQMSAAYIASFIARSKFLPVDKIKVSLELLNEWILQYYYKHNEVCVWFG
jgi:hypothetical protein